MNPSGVGCHNDLQVTQGHKRSYPIQTLICVAKLHCYFPLNIDDPDIPWATVYSSLSITGMVYSGSQYA